MNQGNPLSESAVRRLQELRGLLHEFLADVEAHTIPCAGGRRFPMFANAVALSAAFDGLASCAEAASLEAYKPHRGADGGAKTAVIGHAAAGALQSLRVVLAWPAERWNEEQARAERAGWHEAVARAKKNGGSRPPEPHKRFHWGDIISEDFVATIVAADKALDRAGIQPTKSAASETSPSISDETVLLSEQARVFRDILAQQPPDEPLTGPRLCERYFKETGTAVDEADFRRGIVPALKRLGAKNKPRLGYYFPADALGRCRE